MEKTGKWCNVRETLRNFQENAGTWSDHKKSAPKVQNCTKWMVPYRGEDNTWKMWLKISNKNCAWQAFILGEKFPILTYVYMTMQGVHACVYMPYCWEVRDVGFDFFTIILIPEFCAVTMFASYCFYSICVLFEMDFFFETRNWNSTWKNLCKMKGMKVPYCTNRWVPWGSGYSFAIQFALPSNNFPFGSRFLTKVGVHNPCFPYISDCFLWLCSIAKPPFFGRGNSTLDSSRT